MSPEDIKLKAEELKNRMNDITNSFVSKADIVDDMEVQSGELEALVESVIETSNVDMESVECKNTQLATPTEALNLATLIEDFNYVRSTLKTNADAGRRIIANVTLSILNFDDETELSDKAVLISAFADVNKSVAVNMDLYLKTYKEISTILITLDKLSDSQDKLNGNDRKKPEKEINTVDLIKKLNTIEE